MSAYQTSCTYIRVHNAPVWLKFLWMCITLCTSCCSYVYMYVPMYCSTAVSHVALNSLFAFVGSHPVKVATVAFDKLRNGDHLLVPRLMAKKSYIPECLHNTYRYFHHGEECITSSYSIVTLEA